MSGVEVRSALDEAGVAAMQRLAERAEAADGIAPLNDEARLGLSRSDAGVVHLLAGPPGYAQLDRHAEQTSVVLVVDPEHRRQGRGRALVAAARQAAGPAEPGFWAFGDRPAARGLAAATGLQPVRTLLQLGRSLAELAEPAPSSGITIRAFRPGADDEAWVALNAAAFAHHPEQGAMTVADLRARQRLPWFDPAGFLVATDDRTQEMVGFHWTKSHPDGGDDQTGEVYVLGVAPGASGRGLGTSLLLAGLLRLRETGSTAARLYVEASEEGPVHLYRRHGFTEIARDVMYAAPEQAATEQEGDGPR